jgi:hypothetical protein
VGDESNVQVTYAMADALSRSMRSERAERMILAVLDMLARGVLEVEHPAVATAITHYAPLRPYALGLVLKTMKEAIARGWLTSYASLVRVRQAQGEQATVAEVWLEDLLQELRWFGGAEDEYGLAIPAEEKPLARLRPVKLPPTQSGACARLAVLSVRLFPTRSVRPYSGAAPVMRDHSSWRSMRSGLRSRRGWLVRTGAPSASASESAICRESDAVGVIPPTYDSYARRDEAGADRGAVAPPSCAIQVDHASGRKANGPSRACNR